MSTKTSAEWMSLLDGADIPCMPLNTIDSLLDDQHLIQTGMLDTVTHPTEGQIRQIGVPVQCSKTKINHLQRPARHLGEDSVEVLLETGFTEDQIAHLKAIGATSQF